MFDDRSPSADCAQYSKIITVSSLNRLARETLESAFPLHWVTGEVSNLVSATSGHVYFSLKDSYAQVRCIMYRQRAQLLGWRLENGQHIDIRARVTLYEARGDFQLNVDTARKTGQGNLYEQFLQLKEKLEREGLFLPENKRELPEFPRCLGIVTSPQAAALRDVLSTLERRAPHLDIIVYPAAVQGIGAAEQIASALSVAGIRKECDLLILCRGGGNLEDLKAFNDEKLARAIHACPIPVISGIGHETDFTIADFVADRRAPTPTAAAELAAPERSALMRLLDEHRRSLKRQIQRIFGQKSQRLDGLAQRLLSPEQRLERRRENLLGLRHRLVSGWKLSHARHRNALASLTNRLFLARPDTSHLGRRVDALALRLRGAFKKNRDDRFANLAKLESGLAHLNPEKVLARGYSIVSNNRNGIIRDSRQLKTNDSVVVSFHRGSVNATVMSVTHKTGGLPEGT